MSKKSTFVYTLILFLTLFSLPAAAQSSYQSIDLARTTPSWIAVLGGNPLCQPVRTSYGYALVQEGKMISAITSSGTVLWQKGFTARLQPFLSTADADMLYAVSGTSTLNMLNPGGVLLWSADCGFPVTEAPLPGRDGRVFVRGKNHISCYGLKGIQRWTLETEDQDTSLPLTELNDGSLLVFFSRRSEGKSIARRITPFGQQSQDIIFTGTVNSVTCCKNGALITFTDGSAGLCASGEQGAYSKWGIQTGSAGLESGSKTIPAVHSLNGTDDGNLAAIITGKTSLVILVDTRDGSVAGTFSASDFNTSSLKWWGATVQGIILSDSTKIECFSPQGDIQWKGIYNPSSPWNYIFPTDSGYLAVCGNDWSMSAYRMKQTLNSSTQSSYLNPGLQSYSQLYSPVSIATSYATGPAIDQNLFQTMSTGFLQGGFIESESDWLPLLDTEIRELSSQWSMTTLDYTAQKPYFQQNIGYNQTVINLCARSGLGIYTRTISSLLKKINDPSLLLALVNAAGTISYDPEGTLLESLDYVLKKVAGTKDLTLLDAICDSTYEICRYMGRPAFYDHGQEMISYLLYPQFNAKTREHARQTLKKIMALKL